MQNRFKTYLDILRQNPYGLRSAHHNAESHLHCRYPSLRPHTEILKRSASNPLPALCNRCKILVPVWNLGIEENKTTKQQLQKHCKHSF